MSAEYTELFADIPDEPALGSVVLDKAGVAIQRRKMAGGDPGWSPAGVALSLFGPTSWSWSRVLVYRGPVRLIWDGATDAPPPAPDLETALRAEQATTPGGLAEPLAR